MKCMYCGCTDLRACPGGCWWMEPNVCSACSARLPQSEPGQLWTDADGPARICGVVPVEGVSHAVLLRTRSAGGRTRRPFLFPVPSLFAGHKGWRHIPLYDPERLPAPNELGMFSHPDLPECGEGESIIPLLLAQGFEGKVVSGEGDQAFPEDLDMESGDTYFAALRSWTPARPEGEGWLLVAVYDHENGPHALFVRSLPEPVTRKPTALERLVIAMETAVRDDCDPLKDEASFRRARDARRAVIEEGRRLAAAPPAGGVAVVSLDDLASIYATIPKLPVTSETTEAATNALLAFCYLPAIRYAIDAQLLPAAPWGVHGEYLQPLRHAIATSDVYDRSHPRHLRIVSLRMDAAEALLARAELAAASKPKAEEIEALARRLIAHADAHANVTPHDDEQEQWERDLREAARLLADSPRQGFDDARDAGRDGA